MGAQGSEFDDHPSGADASSVNRNFRPNMALKARSSTITILARMLAAMSMLEFPIGTSSIDIAGNICAKWVRVEVRAEVPGRRTTPDPHPVASHPPDAPRELGTTPGRGKVDRTASAITGPNWKAVELQYRPPFR